jgi:uncharacterized protein (DUF342 family)
MKNREDLFAFSLFTVREAEARVDTSDDLLRAELFLRKGMAGARPLEMRTVSQVIRDSKIQGFNAEELKTAIHSFMDGTTAAMRYVMIEGKAATRGADKEVQLLIKPLEDELKSALVKRFREMRAAPDPKQGFPISEADELALAEKGMKLAQISQPPQGEQGMDVYGRLIPGLPGNDPELKLFKGLRQQGSFIIADTEGLLLIKGGGKVFWGTIVDYRDARVTVHISQDAMEASAEIKSELGPGRPLTRELVLKALAEAGIVRGINNEAVETACKLAKLRGSAVMSPAQGEAPVAAGEMSVHWMVPVKSGESCPVTGGMLLAELTPATENRAGFDVKGAELQPAAEPGPALNWDNSILVKESGTGKKLFAAQGGELSLNGTSLSISILKGIKGDVGEATGNINFSGEVRISGKVQSGFSVIGGRDVLIGGSAGGALISSGGKTVIVQGINGAGKGIVRAKTTIETAFAEKATLLSVEDIKIVHRCFFCTIKTNGRVILSGEGKLTGGICKARRGVHAAELGAEEKVHTEISFGQDYLIKDQIEASEREIEKLRTALAGIEEVLKEAAAEKLEAAGAEKVRLLKLLEQQNLKIFTLREKFEEHHDSEIQIRGTVYPGVVMESHNRYYEITEKRQGVVFYFNRETGRIMERNV